ncbi:MAG: hypothetical protein JNJ71_15180 [Rubrivivax sp.]|nr:hypothetical protein [Rubrivivax sp.]
MSRLQTLRLPTLGVLLVASLLVACSDRRDTTSTTRKVDDSVIAGAQPGYHSPGWKAGDATSWEVHMRMRAQAQNEYVKTGN